jgi:deazaflavin-dependent oxidoreductase (nitroreductase family)
MITTQTLDPGPTLSTEDLAAASAPSAEWPAADGPTAPALAPPPAQTDASRRTHAVFLKVNRFSTVPLLRAGLGPWLGTPIGGYLLLLRARGRTSGMVRETPLSYLVAEGAAWVCAGMGPGAHWYRNILADPHVEVVLPGRTVACIAEDVADPEVRGRMMPALVRAIGLPGALGGVDPRRAMDEEILAAYGWVPLIRLRPVEGLLAAGPDDPGGTAWIWRQVVMAGLFVAVARVGSGLIRLLFRRR